MITYLFNRCLIAYLKLGIDFPFESLISSRLVALRNVPVFGSSTVADFSFRPSLSTKSFGFKDFGASETDPAS